jgi:hypothetical protein
VLAEQLEDVLGTAEGRLTADVRVTVYDKGTSLSRVQAGAFKRCERRMSLACAPDEDVEALEVELNGVHRKLARLRTDHFF